MIPIITPIMEIIMETAMATLVIAMEIPETMVMAMEILEMTMAMDGNIFEVIQFLK